jgi:phage N-6-adenine-methyltransferase
MALNEGMFSSNTDLWATPMDFYKKLSWEFGGFDLDVCALEENAKCDKYFTPDIDGLKQDWSGHKCWMNPPYGRTIGEWVKKAYEESQKPMTMVVCLLPARTDTKWWQEYCMKAQDIRFVKGRLKFGNAKDSAPFPSAVVIFRNDN